MHGKSKTDMQRGLENVVSDNGKETLLLSVVIPCFNEEDSVQATHKRLTKVIKGIPDLEFEIIYVDDGSDDRTEEALQKLQRKGPGMKYLRLSRNFGHQVAITAGMEHAQGDAVVIFDADLQDPPEVIAKMVQKWQDGWQVVYGKRIERQGETRFKLWTAKLFYRLINYVSDVKIPLDTGDFRLLDRTVVDALLAMPERDRFVRGMVSWVGFRQTEVLYHRAPRLAGTTKYPFLRMLHLATDGIVSFSRAPLKLATLVGFLTSGFALIGILYALVLRLFTQIWVPGWTLLFITSMFMGGIQLISLGVIGEYIGRIYGEVKNRPLYFVQERIGFEGTNEVAGSSKEKTVVVL